MRKDILVEGQYYHIFNRSIAGFKIFNNNREYSRFIDLIRYYQFQDRPVRYSYYLEYLSKFGNIENNDDKKLVSIVSFCLMPTHFHLLLKQLKPNGISILMSIVENSFTRYFNTLHKRKGPLWESRFKNVLVSTDEQLLHLTRYIHLNPVTADLIKKPEKWEYSSYPEYLKGKRARGICEFDDILDIQPKQYREFANDRKNYQRQLSIIKSQLIDSYTG